MRCARCLRVLNPAHAMTDSKGFIFGPVCGARLGLTQAANHAQITHKPRINRKTRTDWRSVVVQDGQEALFEGLQ